MSELEEYDLISRQVAIDACHKAYALGDVVAERLQKLPSIAPVKHGKWKRIDKDNMFFAPHILQCSICGNILDTHGVNAGRGDANYCPVCGAKMKGDEE